MSPMRIGDAERDQAVSTLADHYAAGRLTKDEYDERTTQAWSARFEHDIIPLFDDLPGDSSGALSNAVEHTTARTEKATARSRSRRRGPHPALLAVPLLWIAPMAMVALIALLVITGAPWLLFIAFWFFACSGFGRRRWHHGRSPWVGGASPTKP
jgi:hypothetical protein